MLSLIDICCSSIARALLTGNVPAQFPASVPEPELSLSIYNQYTVRSQAVGPRDHTALLRHLLVLQAFSEEWHVRQLHLSLPEPRSCRALSQLRLVSSQLRHLELTDAAWLAQLDWLLLPPPHQQQQHGPQQQQHYGQQPQQAEALPLTCLALRGCLALRSGALGPLAVLATSLCVLDLSGAEALDDSCAGVLASLRALQVLNLSYTAVGDATLNALTYGARAASWARMHGLPPPAEAAAWPELVLHRLHLAGTRVTAAGVVLLADVPRLTFLDVRGVGVPRAALRPLENRFALTLVQGAVLASSNALAAALINHPDQLACACQPADMAAMSLGQAAPVATARARRRQQSQRLRAQRGLPAVPGRNGHVEGASRAYGVDGLADTGLCTVPVVVPVGGGEGGGGGLERGWEQQWSTQGIRQMIDTAEALLRAEGYSAGPPQVQTTWGGVTAAETAWPR